MSRFLTALLLFAAFTGFTTLGCERREPNDPSDFIAAETARVAYAERVRKRAHVTCSCDADGGLHVVAPEGSVVTGPEDLGGSGDAEADIFFADEGPSHAVRGTVSLGFIGDNKLTYEPRGNDTNQGYSYPAWTSGGGGRSSGYSGRGGGGRSGGSSGGRGAHPPR